MKRNVIKKLLKRTAFIFNPLWILPPIVITLKIMAQITYKEGNR